MIRQKTAGVCVAIAIDHQSFIPLFFRHQLFLKKSVQTHFFKKLMPKKKNMLLCSMLFACLRHANSMPNGMLVWFLGVLKTPKNSDRVWPTRPALAPIRRQSTCALLVSDQKPCKHGFWSKGKAGRPKLGFGVFKILYFCLGGFLIFFKLIFLIFLKTFIFECFAC